MKAVFTCSSDILQIIGLFFLHIHLFMCIALIRLRALLCLVRFSSKIKLSLCLSKHDTMKAYWWSRGIARRILDLGSR
jgi:hypothetical protein